VEPIREPLVFYVEGCSSASQAPKFARGIGLKSKLYLAFVLNCYRVALLRHLVLIVKFVVPRKSGRLTDVAGSLMEYVTLNACSTNGRRSMVRSIMSVDQDRWQMRISVFGLDSLATENNWQPFLYNEGLLQQVSRCITQVGLHTQKLSAFKLQHHTSPQSPSWRDFSMCVCIGYSSARVHSDLLPMHRIHYLGLTFNWLDTSNHAQLRSVLLQLTGPCGVREGSRHPLVFQVYTTLRVRHKVNLLLP
jgi:hypothetical protein